MKVLLRQYKIIGTMSDTFSNHTIKEVADTDGCILPEFAIPKLRTFLPDNKETDNEITQVTLEASKDPEGVTREIVASRRFITCMNDSNKTMTDQKVKDDEVARLGKALHNRMVEMLWDSLTLMGQADIAITDVRESKLVECLTPNFASTVKNASE